MTQESPVKDAIVALINTVHKDMDTNHTTPDILVQKTRIWLRMAFLVLKKPYIDTTRDYIPDEATAMQYITNESYIPVCNEFYKALDAALTEQLRIFTEKKKEWLLEYYESKNVKLNFITEEDLETRVQNSMSEILEAVRILPERLMGALQLQYLFGFGVLSPDFLERVQNTEAPPMVFARTATGGFQNYVLFRGFTAKSAGHSQSVTLTEFCALLATLIDSRNGGRVMKYLCKNLILETVNAIAYSKAIQRNYDNRVGLEAFTMIADFMQENRDIFPSSLEEFETVTVEDRHGSEVWRHTDVDYKESVKPKKSGAPAQIEFVSMVKDTLDAFVRRYRLLNRDDPIVTSKAEPLKRALELDMSKTKNN